MYDCIVVQPFRRVVLEDNSEGELDGESDDGEDDADAMIVDS